MYNDHTHAACGHFSHVNRRTLLKATAAASVGWLNPVSTILSRAAEKRQRTASPQARSVIVLWLQGGPSQLETFDPHPGTEIGGETKAIKTSVGSIRLAEGLDQLADQMEHVSIVRSVVSKEGDHERATYNMKTGFRPDPTLVHPAIGSVLCHQLQDQLDIPRHVSIFPGQWPARGGYLGDQFDAFKVYDPRGRVSDISARVAPERFSGRIDDLVNVVESEFLRGRRKDLDKAKTLHLQSVLKAQRMMSSEQLDAFDVTREPQSLRDEYGDTDFGRGCLAALRLIQAGVRCVEVTLNGWDSHVSNYALQRGRVDILDPAFAALIRDLRRRELFDQTVVICGGEFGRTPKINGLEGRDHWPHGFSIALAGGGIRGGRIVGETSPETPTDDQDRKKHMVDPRNVEDIHATVLQALKINYHQELQTPVGRPMAICQGKPIKNLL